jgi:hypothetical protein
VGVTEEKSEICVKKAKLLSLHVIWNEEPQLSVKSAIYPNAITFSSKAKQGFEKLGKKLKSCRHLIHNM